MNIGLAHVRYSQFFVICLLGVSIYITTQSLASGVAQFESNLWNRSFLISSFTWAKLRLGDRVFSQALVGKDGWLEYTGEHNMDGDQNAIHVTSSSWRTTQQDLALLYEEMHKRNITLILVVPPEKSSIYPDKLPDEIHKFSPQSVLDSFSAYLQSHGPHVLIDLRPALQNGRQRWEVFYRTDTHWNGYGAFIGYTVLMKELAKTYPELEPGKFDEYTVTSSPPVVHDIAQIMGATHTTEPFVNFTLKKDIHVNWLTLNDERIPLKISTTDSHAPTLLMYMDSFGTDLQSFLAPDFSKATYIMNTSKYPGAISLRTIDIIKPNVVILEVAERILTVRFLHSFLNQLITTQN